MNKSTNTVLCIAPHPDDETLGCGGTLLRHIQDGAEVHWLIATSISTELGFSSERVARRAQEIKRVAAAYGFREVHECNMPTTRLDTIPKGDLVHAIGTVISKVRPDTLLVPYRNDVHSDHAAVFDAAVSCSKTFRYPSIRSVYAYETLSETEYSLRPDDPGFKPNSFVEITQYLDRKLEIMRMFDGEMGQFPFPRSEESIRALATLRGGQAGCLAAESFMLLKEIR